MSYFAGIDLHKRYLTLCVLGPGGSPSSCLRLLHFRRPGTPLPLALFFFRGGVTGWVPLFVDLPLERILTASVWYHSMIPCPNIPIP